jgi:hypothetical protein
LVEIVFEDEMFYMNGICLMDNIFFMDKLWPYGIKFNMEEITHWCEQSLWLKDHLDEIDNMYGVDHMDGDMMDGINL